MFVHNYRTAAVWVQGHVGKKEMGREEGKPQVETRVREREGQRLLLFFLMVRLVAILDTILNN